MMAKHLVARVREVASGSTRWLPYMELIDAHGHEVVSDFLRPWQDWQAIDRRKAVLLRGPHSGLTPEDVEEVVIMHAYSRGDGWSETPERRRATVDRWLADEARLEQIALFRLLAKDETILDPQDCLEVGLLVMFTISIDKYERLPSRDYLRMKMFPSRSKVIPPAQRQAFKRALAALGMTGLPSTESA